MPEFAANDGATLHYIVCGNGTLPTIYLHWMGNDAGSWDGLWAALGCRAQECPRQERRNGAERPRPTALFASRVRIAISQPLPQNMHGCLAVARSGPS